MERRKVAFMEVDASYYDLREVLAFKQILRCLFPNSLAPEIFHLIGQSPPDMEGGICRADLPLFMIRVLPNGRVIPPKEFGSVQLEAMRAKPEHVDVMRRNQFYFILSKYIAKMVENEHGRTLAEVVFPSFQQRCGWILDNALRHNPKSEKLDSMEVKLYQTAADQATLFALWFRLKKESSLRKRDSSHFSLK